MIVEERQHMMDALGEREGCRIEDFATGFESFLMEVAAPAGHAFVGQFRLQPLVNQAMDSRGIVALDAEDSGVLDLGRCESFANKSDAHLAFKKNSSAFGEKRHDGLDPLKSHGALPGSSRLMPATEGCHDLG